MWRSIVMWVGGTHYNQAPMSEWSKEPDLRPALPWVRIPLGAIPSGIWVKYTTFSYSVVVITLDFEKYLYEVIKRPRFDFGWEKIVSIYAIIIWII